MDGTAAYETVRHGSEDGTAAYETVRHGSEDATAYRTEAVTAPYRTEAATAPYRTVDETLALRSAGSRVPEKPERQAQSARAGDDGARHDVTVELPTALTGAPSRGDEPDPVFVDSSGGRRRLLRKFGWLLGAASLGYAVVLGVSLAGGDAGAPDVLIPGPEKKASDKADPSPSESGSPTPGTVAEPGPDPSKPPKDENSPAPVEEATGGGADPGRNPVKPPSAARPEDRPATKPTPSKKPSNKPRPSDTEDPPPDPDPDPDPGSADPGGETAVGAGGAG